MQEYEGIYVQNRKEYDGICADNMRKYEEIGGKREEISGKYDGITPTIQILRLGEIPSFPPYIGSRIWKYSELFPLYLSSGT